MGAGEYIEVDGINIYYEKKGTGDQIVLLLAGVLGTVELDFGNQMEEFDTNKFTLIAWDPPGYGRSRPPDKVYKDWYRKDADLAVKMLKKLGVEKCSVMGFSDGARTALYVTSMNPDLVDKLVIWGGSTYVTPKEKKYLSLIRDISGWSNERRSMYEKVYGSDVQAIWGKWIDTFPNNLQIPRDVLTKIKCPTFILHGEKDVVTSADPHVAFMRNNIKMSKTHIFKGASHTCHQDHPKEFNALVQTFLLKGDQRPVANPL